MKLYHGTSKSKWKSRLPFTLILCKNIEDAEHQAEQSLLDETDARIVLEFNLQDLMNTQYGKILKKDKKWTQTFEETGMIYIHDFFDGYKNFGKVVTIDNIENNSKYSKLYLNEATNINMVIINEIVNQVFNMLPEQVGLSTLEHGLVINGNRLNLGSMKKRFPNFEDFFDHIKETKFLFINAPQYENNATMGLYNADKNIVVVNLSNTMGMYTTHKKEYISKKSSNTDSPYAVLVHEIRHVMQHKDYPDYFGSDVDRQKQYKERDIEIDAAWYNIIAVYDPKKFKPAAYVTRVMGDLKHYRTLKKNQEDHYYKKTLKYYSDPNYFENNPRSKNEILINTVSKKVLKYLEKVENTYDLRTIKGYNKDNFLFPIRNVIAAIRSGATFHDAKTNFVKNMMYFVPSLYMPKTLAKVWLQYMKIIQSYTLDNALENFQSGMPPDLFDYEAMKNHMKDFYS